MNKLSQNLRNVRDYGTTKKYSGTLAPRIESVKQYVQYKDGMQEEEPEEDDQRLALTAKERALINKIMNTKSVNSGQLNHFQVQARFKKTRIKQNTNRVQVDPT